jgi:polar amino acid transport system substrate-binding protein
MLKIEKSAHQNEKARASHAELGYRMLVRIRLWEDVAPIVHNHHEWYDGTGYPEGLAENDIALESRIISVCESFDAMTSDTSYKVAIPLEAALEEIRSCTGTQFDPLVAKTFLDLVEQGLISNQ